MYLKDKLREFLNLAFKLDKQFLIRSEVLNYVKTFCYDRSKNSYRCAFYNNQVRLRNLTSDFDVFKQVIIDGEYSFVRELYEFYYHNERVKCVVDIGANIGITSLYFNHLFPYSEIFCIEADDENFAVLQENVEVSKNIFPLHFALWKNNEDLFINRGFRDGRNWSRKVNINGNSSGSGKVKGITLLEFLDEKDIEIIDILKIDIEGAEKEVFFEDPTIFNALGRVRLIALEVHDESVSRILLTNFFHDNGFKIFSKGETVFCLNHKINGFSHNSCL